MDVFLHADIILFSHRYSQMDTDFYHEDEYVLNTNITLSLQKNATQSHKC